MTKWLLHRFIHDADNTGDQRVRGAYGTLASCVGICINLLLALTKFLVGIVTGSVAVTADAANNLSDAGGSIVSLVSVRMAQKPWTGSIPMGTDGWNTLAPWAWECLFCSWVWSC